MEARHAPVAYLHCNDWRSEHRYTRAIVRRSTGSRRGLPFAGNGPLSLVRKWAHQTCPRRRRSGWFDVNSCARGADGTAGVECRVSSPARGDLNQNRVALARLGRLRTRRRQEPASSPRLRRIRGPRSLAANATRETSQPTEAGRHPRGFYSVEHKARSSALLGKRRDPGPRRFRS